MQDAGITFALANAISTEGMNLVFDYFRLHRSCWMVLRAVHESVKESLRTMFGPGYLEHENQLPFVVGYLFMAAFSAENIGRDLLPGAEVRSSVLSKAADSLKEFIGSGAGSCVGKIVEGSFNYAMDREGIDDE